MKSNRTHTAHTQHKHPNLYQTLKKEKETLVSMFLASATQNELTEQIKKIDELCCKIDNQRNTRSHRSL
jgi:hypothetical protein